MRVIAGQPHLAFGVLPGEGFHRQVYSGCLAVYHQRRTAARVTKNNELRRTKLNADLCGAVGVIYAGEHNKTAPCRTSDNTIDRF